MEFGSGRSSRGGTSSSLHNFSSLPSWGTQLQLRCVKPSELTRYSVSSNPLSSSSDDDGGGRGGCHESDDGGIEAVKQKLMTNFRAEVDKLQSEFLNRGKNSATAATVAETSVSKPWNLRTRRAGCKDPSNNDNGTNVVHRKPKFSPARSCGNVNSPVRIGKGEGNGDEKGKKRAKFSNSLSKAEIEADFLALTGARPARRPKKRAKLIQNEIDRVLPGSGLTEVTADMYKVIERVPAGGKKYCGKTRD